MSVLNIEVPDKSQSDKKLYRALELSNGLRVMLVSQPEMNDRKSTGAQESDGVSQETSSTSSDSLKYYTAACVCNISVGSFYAPKKYPGLVHFLERIIFKGSEKYPEDNAYKFLTTTEFTYNFDIKDENTYFYFQMEERDLDKTLDMFIDFIKAPLMSIDSISRERSAVQSHYWFRNYRVKVLVKATMANEKYPHATLGCESLLSLLENVTDVELHKELHEFHRKHYGSNRMTVCVQSILPLDELQKIVLRHCSNIPRSLEEAMDASKFNYRNAFQDQFFRDVLYVKKNDRILELTWVLPSMHGYYRVKPCELMSYLLGSEGVGSLCAYLRHRVWAGRVDAGHHSNTIFAQFFISIELTDEGIQHLDEVMAVTFAWIRMLCSTNIPLSTYKEVQQLAETNFRFQRDNPEFPLIHVANYVDRIDIYPIKDWLTGKNLFFEYNEEIVKKVQQLLSEFRFQILLLTETPHILYDQKERCTGTQFAQITMPDKWKKMWTNPEPHPELKFPAPNPFVPTDFAIHWVKAGKPHIPRRPKALIRNELCELWFRQDDTFLLPEGVIIMKLLTPVMQQSVKDYLTGIFFIDLVKFEFDKLMQPANAAGLDYHLEAKKTGLQFEVRGYNEKMPLLCDMLVNMFKNVEVNPGQVKTLRMKEQRTLYYDITDPKDLSNDLWNNVVQQKGWTLHEKYKAINTITPQDVERFRDTFHKQMYIQALIQGNFTEQQARQITENVLNTFKSGKFENYADMRNRTVRLPHGEFFLRVKSFKYGGNTALTNYHQLGPSSVTMSVMLELLDEISYWQFYEKLLYEEQICHRVKISFSIINNIGGYMLEITTPEDQFSVDFVQKRVENFYWTVHSIVSQLSQKKYRKLRQALIDRITETNESLLKESYENWAEIDSMEYFFNRNELRISTLAVIEKKDVLKFMELYINTNMRILSVQVISTPHPKGSELDVRDENKKIGDELNLEFIGDPRNPTHIMNIAEFKKNLYVYPHISIYPK